MKRALALLAVGATGAAMLGTSASAQAVATPTSARIALSASTVAPGAPEVVKLITTGRSVGRTANLQELLGARWVTQRSVKIPGTRRTSVRVSYPAPGIHLLRWRVLRSGRASAINTKTARVTVLWPTTALWTSDSVLSSSGYNLSTDTKAEVNGTQYQHALSWDYGSCGSCSPSSTTWNLGRSWRSFHAVLGVDDGGRSGSSYEAEFFGDGKPLYRQVVSFATTTNVDLDVTGVVHLTFDIAPGNTTIPVLAQPFASGAPSAHPSAHATPVVTFLADQSEVASTGYSFYQGYAHIGGHQYPRAIYWDYESCGSCGRSTLDYNLGRSYDRITGFAGIGDPSPGHSNATITFVVDGAPVSTLHLSSGSAVPFDLNVAGGLRLQIQVTVAGQTTPEIADVRLLAGADMPPSAATPTPQYY